MALTSGILGILKQLALPFVELAQYFAAFARDAAGNIIGLVTGSGNNISLPLSGLLTDNTPAAASANSAIIFARTSAGRPCKIDGGLGVIYHDRTIEVKSYGSLEVGFGTTLRLFAGSSCPQVANWYAQRVIDATTFVSVASNVATFVEKGHNREVGDQVFIENCRGNTGLNGLQTITSVGTNGAGFRFWTIAAASNAALTNDTYQRVFVARYNPLAGSSFSRTQNAATITATPAKSAAVSIAITTGYVTWPAHALTANAPVTFVNNGGATFPPEIQPGITYYYKNFIDANTIQISATPGGAVIATTAASTGSITGYSGVITFAWPLHTLKIDDEIFFTSSGALPFGLVSGTKYYVDTIIDATNYTISATAFGATYQAAGGVLGSGVHTCYSYGTVLVSQPGHRVNFGDSVYIAGVPVVQDSFNGSYLVTEVVAGVSWSFKQLGRTEIGTGTANLATDTAIKMDIACLDYNAANNVFDQNWAVNAWLGNIGNSDFWFHQNIDGRTRSVQIFNGGDGVTIHKHIASKNSGTCKGTLQIEAYAGHLVVGHSEMQGGTDDNVAWGQTPQLAPFGGTASPSGTVYRMGTLTVASINGTTVGNGSALKLFTLVDGTDLGSVYCGDLGGSNGVGLILVGTNGFNSVIRSVHVGILRCYPMPNSNVGVPALIQDFLRVESLRIDEFIDTAHMCNITQCSAQFANVTVGDLHIGSAVFQQNRGNGEIGFFINTGATVENFTIDSANVRGQAGYDFIRVQGTGVIQNMNLNGTRYIAPSIFVGNCIRLLSGGTLQHLNVDGYKGNNHSVICDGVSASATALIAKFNNVTCAGLANIQTALNATLYLGNVGGETNGANMLSLTGTGVVRVVGGPNVTHQAGFFCSLASGTPTISINCPGAQINVDPAVSTRLVPLAGDVVYNTNAALGTLAQAGPVVRRGSDSKWVLMADTTKVS